MAKTTPETKTLMVRRALKFDLTEAELTAKMERSLELEKTIEDATQEVKAFAKEKRDEIKDVIAERKQLRACIDTKQEEREVKCHEEYDYKKGIVTTLYNGKKMDQRPMYDSERQEDLPLTKKDFEGPETAKDVIKMETNRRTKHDASTAPN